MIEANRGGGKKDTRDADLKRDTGSLHEGGNGLRGDDCMVHLDRRGESDGGVVFKGAWLTG